MDSWKVVSQQYNSANSVCVRRGGTNAGNASVHNCKKRTAKRANACRRFHKTSTMHSAYRYSSITACHRYTNKK